MQKQVKKFLYGLQACFSTEVITGLWKENRLGVSAPSRYVFFN